MNKLDASFRDPDGFLFTSAGRLLRQVNASYRENYRLLMDSGLYDALVKKRQLVPHVEIDDLDVADERACCILEPERIPFISYPYEWCFSQIKDAALLTLEIQKTALAHGMSLKDASAYNIQFVGSRPVFIDTLSFEAFTGQPWPAYRQFCQHFLAPLALVSHTDRRLSQLLKVFIDGVPLDLAVSLLPGSTKFSPGLLAHLHLHAKSQSKYSDKGTTDDVQRKISSVQMTPFKATAFIDQLASTVSRIRWKSGSTEWGDYYGDTNYDAEALDTKARLIREYFHDLPDGQRLCQDLGANDGRFAREIAGEGRLVVCFDIDEIAVEKNYLSARQADDTSILPLIQDLTNPSPAIGWAGAERDSLAARGPVQVTLALALIHHIALSANVPLDRIAAYLATLTHYLIIEFVPKSDSQVRRLLATREDVFPDYTEDGFEASFSGYFRQLKKSPIAGTDRTLYLWEKSAM